MNRRVASLAEHAPVCTLVAMSAARVSRVQQQRTRLKAVQAELEKAVANEHDEFLDRAAHIEHAYLDATLARKRFIKEFLAIPKDDRPAQVDEVAAAMGLSTKRLYQMRDLK